MADEGSGPGSATDDFCNLGQVILSLRQWILGGCLLYSQFPAKNMALNLCSAASVAIQICASHCSNWILDPAPRSLRVPQKMGPQGLHGGSVRSDAVMF